MGRPIHAQRGAILVLTAFLLPFIIAFTGLAVDFGNLYVQHQRLQNAADAAVLAGAKAYAENNEIKQKNLINRCIIVWNFPKKYHYIS